MPLEIPQIALALTIILTVLAGVWLMINARAVARTFRSAGLEPGPGPRLASRQAVVTALVAFNLGWIASIAIWSWAMTDEAPDMIDADS